MRISSARQGTRVIEAQSKKPTFSSRVELGKEYSILIPTEELVDPITGEKYIDAIIEGFSGRSCDYESLGVSFCKIDDDKSNEDDTTDSSKRIVDRSGISTWATLSSIIYKAKMESAIFKRRNELEMEAERSGKEVDKKTLEQAIEKIKEEYLGRKKTATEDAIMPKHQRLISSDITFSTMTEALLIELDGQLNPIFDKAIAVEMPLSKTKLNQICEILNNPNYCEIGYNSEFLEIRFSYKGTEKKVAGRNALLGVEKNVRKVNLAKNEDGTYIDPKVEAIKGKLRSITHNHDLMYERSFILGSACSPKELESAMRRYLADNSILFTFIDFEDDILKKNASKFKELNVFDTETKQYKQLLEIIESTESDKDTQTFDTYTSKLKDVTGGTTVKSVVDAINSDDELSDMMSDNELGALE